MVLLVEDALRAFQDTTRMIDIVLSEVVMLGMGGVQLGKTLREIRHGARTTFCTGYIHHVGERINERGETPPILTKPYERTDLVRNIRSLLGDRSGPKTSPAE